MHGLSQTDRTLGMTDTGFAIHLWSHLDLGSCGDRGPFSNPRAWKPVDQGYPLLRGGKVMIPALKMVLYLRRVVMKWWWWWWRIHSPIVLWRRHDAPF